jgi:antitoxin component YwqK of YwqJK toxin-antitoxin module
MHYENTSGEKGVSIYDVSTSKPDLAVWELLDGSRYSLNELSYDDTGNLVQKARVFSDSLTSMTTYEYDESGNKIHETFSRSDGRTGEVDYIHEGGRLIRADCRGLNGWFHGVLDIEYDDSGLKTGTTITKDGESIGSITYTYDENGNLGEEVWQFHSGWSQTFRYEYVRVIGDPRSFKTSSPFIPDMAGVRVATEQYDWSGQGGGPSFYQYAEGTNRLLRKRFVRSDGLETVTRYLYGPSGELLRSFRSYADGRVGLFRYVYDGQLHLTSKEFFRSDGLKGLETFEYDGKGRLVAAEYLNMDGWLTGSISFAPDESGHPAEAAFTGTGDREGLEAEIEFENNDTGQPTRIHWDFGEGRSQTYTFEYETY